MPPFLKNIGISRTKLVLIVLAVVLIGGGAFLLTHHGKKGYQFVSVTKGSIVEAVSVTGNTTPIKSVSLSFGNTGTIARVYVTEGSHVAAGTVLAALNTGDFAAQLKQAQANIDAQQARLEGLKAGSRPEEIAAAQASYDKAVQDLANLYAGVSDTLQDAHDKANDAVRTQLSAFFSNGDTDNPHLSFQTTNSQAKTDAESGRAAMMTLLDSWQTDLYSINATSRPSEVEAGIAKDKERLSSLRMFLGTVSTALNGAINLDSTTLATYKANVASALSEVNVAIKNLNSANQNISSETLVVAQAKAQLDLKKAGSSPQDVAAQNAQVEGAKASAASIQAKIGNSLIISPITGLITQSDARVGQIASPGTTLFSVISDAAFEVDTQVSETDIGKVSVGDSVSMTFDAFPNETFKGSVFYIDSAKNATSGAVNYTVKISFSKADRRLKSGLTANADIITKQKEGVLILPQYAILQNDSGTFVEVIQNGKVVDMPVTLGISDSKGMVEVVNGVTEGEQVVNIGLKK